MAAESRDDTPATIAFTDLEDDREYAQISQQLGTGSDPSMRDGNSGRGNPYEYNTGDAEPTSDSDVGDDRDPEHAGYGGSAGGAVGGTPAGKRASGGTLPPGEPVVTGAEPRGDSTIGARQNPDRPDATAASDEPPLPNYKYLSVPEVLEKVGFMTRDEIEQLHRFESRHRKRKTLLTKLNRMLRDEPGRESPSSRAANQGS